MTPAEAHAHNEQIQRAYQVTFANPEARQVLADLVAFCHGRRTTFVPDARLHAFQEGKREVLLRIQEFLNLSVEEIYALRNFARPIAPMEDTDD